ncbi:MAG: alkaline phytoceramidase, partial [Bacteroidota bacterium]
LLLALFTLAAIAIAAMIKPMPQSNSYHNFADRRTIAGIPNFFSVVSNLPFLFVGLYGLTMLRKSTALRSINSMYAILFTGIFLTGLGSAYYHYAPDNNSLVYDRIPMTIVFMAFLSAAIAAWIDVKAGTRLIAPLLLTGVASVLWWHYTELQHAGDLRFYGFIQFYPMLIIPLIFWLFASAVNNKGLLLLVWVIVWYVAAKLFETFDAPLYKATGFISGHSLKHIAAAIATWCIVRFFDRKYIVSS